MFEVVQVELHGNFAMDGGELEGLADDVLIVLQRFAVSLALDFGCAIQRRCAGRATSAGPLPSPMVAPWRAPEGRGSGPRTRRRPTETSPGACDRAAHVGAVLGSRATRLVGVRGATTVDRLPVPSLDDARRIRA